jgi:hypothetical protein
MGSTICTAGFPSPAIASSCFTARCASIWYGFFIATLLFLGKRKLLSAYQKASSGESLLSTIYRTFPDKRLGLLINFNVALIKDGITRIANGMPN